MICTRFEFIELPQDMKPFGNCLHRTAVLMRRWVGADYEEAFMAGVLAILKLFPDRQFPEGNVLDKGHKRFIRREMLRDASKCPKHWGLVDYGITDGRTTKRGPKLPPKDKYARRRHRLMALGLCERCGKPGDIGLRLCSRCRRKKLSYYHNKKS
jgi:hypothetical protein